MLAEDYSNPIDLAQAKIQSYVGEFLASRDKLRRLASSSDIEKQRLGVSLLQTQTRLENELPVILKIVESVKGGAWTFSDVGKVAQFAAELTLHMANVRKATGGGMMTAGVGGLSMFQLAALTTIGAIGIMWAQRRGR